jgi:hypothetical protein
VHWRRQATDGVYIVDIYGTQAIALNPNEPFTPYNQLTKKQIESWLVSSMGAQGVLALDASLDKQINDIKKPTVAAPALPWNT